MRVFVAAAVLLASSSLCSFAQDQSKAPQAPQIELAAPGGASGPADSKSSPPRDQQAGRDPRPDDREMGRDWRLRRGDNERMDRDDRDFGRGGMARRDEDERRGPHHDKYRERYWDRGDREWDRTERDYRGYAEESRPRRRVKICLEYANGEEYCRYRE